MPRIPTRDELQQGVPRPSGGVVSAPRDFSGSALQVAGNKLFAAASQQAANEQAQRQYRQQRTTLELARARSAWNANLAAEQATYTPELKPDIGSWSKTCRKRASALQKTAARGISDPGVRQQFISETDAELVQAGVEIKQRARENEMIVRRAETDNALLQQVDVAASRSDESGKAIMGGVHASLQDMVHAGLITAEEAAGRSVVYAQQYASRKTADLISRDPALTMAMLAGEQPGPAMLIRQLEGFHSTPHWQAGATLAGYGSDTVTRSDGTIDQIVPGMAVNRADADRDLQRRVREASVRIGDQTGGKTFKRLPPGIQAALISVGYRSGALPERLALAVKTGDAEAIASAIEDGGKVDDSVSRRRAIERAAVVRDKAGNIYEQIARRPPWIGVLSPVLKSSLHDAASQELERLDNERSLAERTAAYRLKGDIRSHIRSTYSDGKFPDPDSDDVLREFGEDSHRQWSEVRQDAADVRALSRDMPYLSGDEIRRIVETTRPAPKATDFVRRQDIHNRISRRAYEIMQERISHPARAALRVASVRRALSEVQDVTSSTPGKVQNLVREMLAAQLALGMPKSLIAPIPEEWAIEIGKALAASASGSGGEATDWPAGALQAMYATIKEQFGEFANNVIFHSIDKTRASKSGRPGHVTELVKPLAAGNQK